MPSKAPAWFGQTADVDDTSTYARMTPAERLACFVEVMELSRAILDGRADAQDVLDQREPMPPEAERTWLRLVKEARRARTTR